jgi:hypothetical protein
MWCPQFVNKSVTLTASQAQKFRVIYIYNWEKTCRNLSSKFTKISVAKNKVNVCPQVFKDQQAIFYRIGGHVHSGWHCTILEGNWFRTAALKFLFLRKMFTPASRIMGNACTSENHFNHINTHILFLGPARDPVGIWKLSHLQKKLSVLSLRPPSDSLLCVQNDGEGRYVVKFISMR